MNRYVCIHGHFYQPPRENAWLETVEIQPSAHPYHDWNERVTAECYGPNAASHILDAEGKIADIVNNYSRISFDFGPTLLSWLEAQSPDVYQAIVEADRESVMRFSGHGSALAHVYNHMIMPLANRRDKYTQVLWGFRDFEHRFRRKPEGMWLTETAVDIESLEIMAAMGIKFTVLAPRQASRVRRKGPPATGHPAGGWWNVGGGRVDTTMPYEISLPSGGVMNVFFYNGNLAMAVAFQGLLQSGEEFARRITATLPASPTHPQLAHVATDGESYGHHHRFGDMALAFALRTIETQKLAQLTNYGEFLEIAPPTHEVEIVGNSSWSCAHGIERWRSDCGCTDHEHPGWNQTWRAPLREALDWLRDEVAPRFEAEAAKQFKDPWQARDDYISVILDRSHHNVTRFLGEHSNHPNSPRERIQAIKLMELQRHAMLMYTSCAWFFEDVARIETVQVMQYAARVAQLAGDLFGDSTEARLLELLEKAQSNDPHYGSARQVFEHLVRPTIVDLEKVAAHYGASALFENHPDHARVCCYDIKTRDIEGLACERTDIKLGGISVTSLITGESFEADFLALRRPNSTLAIGVAPYHGERTYLQHLGEINAACAAGDLARIERFLSTGLAGTVYGADALFLDTRYRVLEDVLETKLRELTHLFYPGLRSYYFPAPMVQDSANPLVANVRPLVELVLNLDLRGQLQSAAPDRQALEFVLENARLWQVKLEGDHLGYVFGKTLVEAMTALAASPADTTLLERVLSLVDLARALPFSVDLQTIQNTYWKLLQTITPEFKAKASAGDAVAAAWWEKFSALGEKLKVRVG